MNEIVMVVGGTPVSFGHVVLAALGLTLLALVLLLYFMRQQRFSQVLEAEKQMMNAREAEDRLAMLARIQAEMTGRMQTMAEVFGQRQADLTRHLSERLDGMGHRLGQNLTNQAQSAQENINRLSERLSLIDAAQKNITELAGQVVSLKDVLSNKQARGAFGQARMEAILMDGLPKESFSLQPTLSNGTRPDALISLPGDKRSLVIDAKFPLESLSAWREPQSESDKRAAAQRVRGDMTKHITDIASRYLIAGETLDTALMFVPSEALYADLHEFFDDIIQKSFRSRVVIVSPSLMMLAMQVMQGLLKDERMREEANLIRTEVGHLSEDIGRLRERVMNLQRHFGQANEDIAQILISADKITRRGARIDGLEFDSAPKEPPLPLKGNLL